MCGLAAYTCLSWRKPTRSTDLCACLSQYMKSRRPVERTVPKTRRLELVSRCFTWDPNPRSSHQHPNVASCYSGGVGKLQAKAKDILWKIKGALLFVCSDAVIFAISAVSCLTWWTHMLSCWGFWATDLVLRLASSLHNDATKQVTCKLGKTQALRPVAPVSL